MTPEEMYLLADMMEKQANKGGMLSTAGNFLKGIPGSLGKAKNAVTGTHMGFKPAKDATKWQSAKKYLGDQKNALTTHWKRLDGTQKAQLLTGAGAAAGTLGLAGYGAKKLTMG